MSNLGEIESAVPKLSLTELTELERLVQRELEERRIKTLAAKSPPSRVLGLHQGLWSIAGDFDAPLPEEFWLGTDD